ncbi:hypothetical protein [Streptomyces sp. P9-A2]|uniref:hypothetical protein n=1 Tax=Streptomyces sp. P9-A2 TaxID=3072284 RepID=UPI002FC99FCC
MTPHIVLEPELEAELWDVCIALLQAVAIAWVPVPTAQAAFKERFTEIGGRAGLSSREIGLVCLGFKCWLLTHQDEYTEQYAKGNTRRLW